MVKEPPSIRILRNGENEYIARVPMEDVSYVHGNEIKIISTITRLLNGSSSLNDQRQYNVWYGPHLGISDYCKKGLEAAVNLRNKLVNSTS